MKTDRLAKNMFVFILFIVALCTTSTASFGQGIQSGSVLGTARDSSGAVISGVQVTLKNTETGISVSTATNAQGEYLFPRVGPGKYQVEFAASGFKRYVQPLTVQVVMSTTVDASLEVGELNQTVTVSGQPPLLETASGSLGTLVPNRVIADLPSRGGNPMMVFMLSPGLAQVNGPALAGIGNNGPVSGSGYVAYNSSNGGDSNGNYYQLDGAANE
ncbi:MAG: carboxypeptidase-like regulatory domain-containing protein, partial [Bryobacteraceae bacterium]